MNSFTTPTLPLLPPSRFKRWLATISAVLLTTLGFTAIAPAAQAAPSEVTATVFSVPGWDYANVRRGPSTDKAVVSTISAGSTVTLGCSTHGGNVTGPYGTSDLWYKVAGTDTYIADVMVSTGSDNAVTEECTAFDLFAPKKPLTNPDRSFISVKWTLGGNGHSDPNVPTDLYRHYLGKDGKPGVDTYIDWAYFSEYQPFVNFACAIPVGGVKTYEATVPKDDIFMFLALHYFDVYRTSEHEFVVTDYYDFNQSFLYGSQYQMAQDGNATEFNVFSGGTLAGKRTTDGTAFTC